LLSEKYIGKAKQHLATLPMNLARSLLEELTDFSVQRKY
jgi:geranylgeranyl pyrophosphate synthase